MGYLRRKARQFGDHKLPEWPSEGSTFEDKDGVDVDVQDLDSSIHLGLGDMIQVTYEDPIGDKYVVTSQPVDEATRVDRVSAWKMRNERGIKRGYGIGMGERDESNQSD